MRARLLLVLTIAMAGCYNPSLQPCEIACSANRACPDGLVCNGQNACAMASSEICTGLPIDAPASISDRVTIEVRDGEGMPAGGVLVVFADSDNAQVGADQITGRDGLAWADLPMGGSATLIYTRTRTNGTVGSDEHATTYLDLWPGAYVILYTDPDQRVRTVSVNWTPPAGLSQFVVHTSCGAPAPGFANSAAISIPERCAMFDVIVTGASATDPTTPPLAAVMLAQTATTIAIPDTAWRKTRTVSGTLEGLPPMAQRTYAANGWATPSLPPTGPISEPVIASDGTLSPFRMPDGVGVAANLNLTYQLADGQMLRQFVNDRSPVTAVSADHDYTDQVLHWLGSSTFDVASRKVSWQIYTAPGFMPGKPTFFATSVQFTRSPTKGVIWRVVGLASRISTPGTMLQTLTLPDIPGVRAFEPLMSDTAGSEFIAQYQVESEALRDVIQILDTTPSVGLFKIPELRHVTIAFSL